VRVGRKDPALAQLRAGRARLQRAEAMPARRAAYARAQRDARRHERGLWGC
jgi:endonuclease YncB( thermonuclease family)